MPKDEHPRPLYAWDERPLHDIVAGLYQAAVGLTDWEPVLRATADGLGLRELTLRVTLPGRRILHLPQNRAAIAGASDEGFEIVAVRIDGALEANVLYRGAEGVEPMRHALRKTILTHIERTLAIWLRTRTTQAQLREAQRDADCIPYGRFVLDRDLYVHYVNLRGHAITMLNDGIDIEDHRLRLRRRRDRDALIAAFDAATLGSMPALTVPRPSGRWPFALRVAARPDDGFAVVSGELFELIVLDRAPAPTPVDPLLSHGDCLTPVETRVLRGLLGGLSIDAIAVQWGIARSTVRLHVAHILKKLGVHRQSELLLRVQQPLMSRLPDVDPDRERPDYDEWNSRRT